MIYEVTVKYLNEEAKPVKESILICEAVNFAVLKSPLRMRTAPPQCVTTTERARKISNAK